MANVTPQSLNSLGLYELLAEKKKKIRLLAMPLQPSAGWEASPCVQPATNHTAAAQRYAQGPSSSRSN